ncbi:MAG: hypothetical protein HC927_06005 [Deltaproteobacteria bacterium]|nr:hypothetical protein [Deltaproteobacteria bacterium]
MFESIDTPYQLVALVETASDTPAWVWVFHIGAFGVLGVWAIWSCMRRFRLMDDMRLVKTARKLGLDIDEITIDPAPTNADGSPNDDKVCIGTLVPRKLAAATNLPMIALGTLGSAPLGAAAGFATVHRVKLGHVATETVEAAALAPTTLAAIENDAALWDTLVEIMQNCESLYVRNDRIRFKLRARGGDDSALAATLHRLVERFGALQARLYEILAFARNPRGD